MAKDIALFGLIRFRRIPWPTWRGFILLLLIGAGVCYFGPGPLFAYLSPTHPTGGGIMIVEGWIPDYAMQEVLDRFRTGRYTMILTTGVPIEVGHYLSAYGTTAEMSAATLLRMGAPSDKLHPVPARGSIPRDRTLASALALLDWMKASGVRTDAADVITLGIHARRTRMVFQHVLGDSVAVGVVAVPDSTYGPEDWWKTSAGVKDVIGETLGLLYVSTGITTLPDRR